MADETRESAPSAEADLDIFGKPPAKHRDWSHRRREPRGLALAWTVYLMLATIVALVPMVLSGQLSGDVYRPSARVMVVLVTVGLTVLWPVLRVSQAPQGARPVLDVVRDLGVLWLPAMVLLWPQSVLAGWPVRVVGAASVVLIVWGLVSGAGLMIWHRHSRGGFAGRLVLTIFCVGIAGVIPLVLATAGVLSLDAPASLPSAGWVWSPVTGVWEMLRERTWSGMPAAVSGAHWSVLRLQLLISGGVFFVSAIVCRGKPRGVDSPADRR